MTDYWISFRLKSDASYSSRYNALTDAIYANVAGIWDGDTSFLAVRTNETIDSLAAKLKATINPSTDHLVMREIGKDSTRYIGEPGGGFLAFFPNAKKV